MLTATSQLKHDLGPIFETFPTLKPSVLCFCSVHWAVVFRDAQQLLLDPKADSKRVGKGRRGSGVTKGWAELMFPCAAVALEPVSAGQASLETGAGFLRAGVEAWAVCSMCVCATLHQRTCFLLLPLSEIRVVFSGSSELFLEPGGKNARHGVFLVHRAGKLVYSGFQWR